jgi:hypothetical protein
MSTLVPFRLHSLTTATSVPLKYVASTPGGVLDLPPVLRQAVKTQNPLNGELSHEPLTQAVHCTAPDFLDSVSLIIIMQQLRGQAAAGEPAVGIGN